MAARNTAVRSRFDGFAKANPSRLEEIRAIYDATIADLDATAEQFTDHVLAKLAERVEPVAGSASVRLSTVADQRDKFRDAMSSVIGHRVGIAKDDRANEFRGMALHQIAAHCLEQQGINTKGWTKSEIAGRVLAALSTSDFDYLLADAANKRLQNAFTAFPSTWRSISSARVAMWRACSSSARPASVGW
jgi:hypothetical protein